MGVAFPQERDKTETLTIPTGHVTEKKVSRKQLEHVPAKEPANVNRVTVILVDVLTIIIVI